MDVVAKTRGCAGCDTDASGDQGDYKCIVKYQSGSRSNAGTRVENSS